jgi:hypothetical protein
MSDLSVVCRFIPVLFLLFASLAGNGSSLGPRVDVAGWLQQADGRARHQGSWGQPGDDFDNLDYSTFFGAGDEEAGISLAVDASGAIYVTGDTKSFDFPTTAGAFDTTYNGGNRDAFVVKLSPTGSELLYATFLGGAASESGLAITVDAGGSAYVAGLTLSADFPTTPDAFDPGYNGAGDVFVVKLSPDGSDLEYATYLGSTGSDQAYGLAVEDGGMTHISGETSSVAFPCTPGAFDTSYNGGERDAFVAKLSADGADLVYATFLGGADADYSYDVAVDGEGAAYVLGDTYSPGFPVTPGAFDTSHNGGRDIYVAKLDQMGAVLLYSTFLGGSAWEQGYALAVDAMGAAAITGSTRSADFPTTPGAFDTTYNGNYDCLVARLDAAGSELAYATFLGGAEIDGGLGIAVDEGGRVCVAGDTLSSDFPTTPDAFDSTHNGGGRDAFVSQIEQNGLAYSTFLGGSGDGLAFDLAAEPWGAVYVAGHTYSSDFPTTPHAYDSDHNGAADAFATKLLTGMPVPIAFTPAAPQGQVREWHSFSGDFRDATGSEDLAVAQMFLGRRSGDRGGLMVMYNVSKNALYLRDLVAHVWLGPCTPGEPVVLSNGVVSLDCGRSSAGSDGSWGLSVSWRARWVRPLSRPRILRAFLRAVDQTTNDSGFVELGTWKLLPETRR